MSKEKPIWQRLSEGSAVSVFKNPSKAKPRPDRREGVSGVLICKAKRADRSDGLVPAKR